MKASPEQLKESKKLEILLSQSKVGLVGGCIVTTLVVFLFWNFANQLYLMSWLLFYYVLCAVRYQLASNALNEIPQSREVEKIRIRYTILTFLAGASWGLISIYILLEGGLVNGLSVVILAVGLTASGASLYAIYPSVYAAFALPALLPLTAYLLLHGGDSENTYGFLMIIYFVLMSLSAFRLQNVIMKSISIQFENIRLLDDIEREKIQVSDLNKQLQGDLQELRRRDMQLSEEKDKAEDLAEKLLILSTRDGLTGIANRRHFDEYLAKEWNSSVRSGSRISLILCDIDLFKAYNDHYGHQKGDYCLQQVSSILEEYTRREGDLAARYGGEEFAIILPHTTLDNAAIIAEKIRSAIEKAAISHEASDVSNIVTISMGVSTIQPNQTVFSAALIAQADRLLYRAKAQGRNRIVAGECDVEQASEKRPNTAMEEKTAI